MRRHSVSVIGLILLVSILLVGCSQASPEPSKAPAAPTTAAANAATPATASTTAPGSTSSAASTAVPAKKVDYPSKNGVLSIIVPFAAGSNTDLPARAFAQAMEKQLGIPIQILNKDGAGTQVGTTELVRAKPDGYTLGFGNPGTIAALYLDSERKAIFNRKSFQPVAGINGGAAFLAVTGDSRWKSLKDLFEEAKAKPNTVKGSTGGLLTQGHFYWLDLMQKSDAQFILVMFDSGTTECLTNMLGGHVDAVIGHVGGSIASMYKAGQIRILGVTDDVRDPFMPDVPTFREQGYDVIGGVANSLYAPAGTPKEIVDVLAQAAEKALQDPDLKKKFTDMFVPIRYRNPEQLSAFWDTEDARINVALEMARKAQN